VTMMLPLIPLAIAIAIVVEIDRLLERGGGFVIVLPVVRIPPRPPPVVVLAVVFLSLASGVFTREQ